MKVFTDERCTAYARPGHPERPDRIRKTVAKLREQTLLPVEWAAPEPAPAASALRAHDAEFFQSLQQPKADFDADTPAHPGICEHALRAAGGALAAMQACRQGHAAFSLLRPPGHHATRNRAMGFCYLSSIAIAALAARAEGVKRIAIYDFDVHHGNGTEDILLDQPGMAFFSIHQFPCYPGSGQAHRGGNCFNYPRPRRTPRAEYRATLAGALADLKAFKPDLVGVSAGFDAYARDPLANQELEAEDFQWLGQQIQALRVPVFGVLEGGYSADLPELVLAYLAGLTGK